jgi:predicted enzyme related to lactoylglutathione lyase
VFRGFATVSFFADDVAAARDWYSDLFGLEPYFVRPEEGPAAYVEFRVGDHQDEFGIIDRRFAPHPAAPAPSGAVLFWHVDDVEAVLDRLLAMGATTHEPLTPREAGFVTASVVDPFGNILGVMHNPHYLEMHAVDR